MSTAPIQRSSSLNFSDLGSPPLPSPNQAESSQQEETSVLSLTQPLSDEEDNTLSPPPAPPALAPRPPGILLPRAFAMGPQPQPPAPENSDEN